MSSLRYEYRQEVIPLINTAELCNQWDKDGWEIVTTSPLMVQRSVIANGTGQGEPGLFCLLRRPRNPQPCSDNPQILSFASPFQGDTAG